MTYPESIKLQLNSSVSLELRLIPAGEFRMGSRGEYGDEEPIHLVRITRPFYLGATPVTQAQWRAVVDSHPDCGLDADPSEFKGATRPVEQVSWDDCSAWFRLLNERGDFATRLRDQDKELSLVNPQVDFPTEAQWEYACRLMRDSDGQPYTVETEYYTGDGEGALAAAGWYKGNSGGETHRAGDSVMRPTDFGLYDMHGNVWEWCRDARDTDVYKKRVDGVADPVVDSQANDAIRVVRGGSWYFSPRVCRAAFRFGRSPDFRVRYLGFRVCLFFGPDSCPASQTRAAGETGAESEWGSVDVARRQAAAESQDAHADVAEVDLRMSKLPSRSDD